MQGGTAMNSPLSDLFGRGFILPGGRVINARWYSAMRPCLSISGGALLFLLMDMSDKSGWYRAGAPLHGYFPWRRFFIFKSGGQNEFQ